MVEECVDDLLHVRYFYSDIAAKNCPNTPALFYLPYQNFPLMAARNDCVVCPGLSGH